MKRISQTVLTLTAACVLTSSPAWAAQPEPPAPIKKVKQDQGHEFSQELQKSLDRLASAVPVLKDLRIEDKRYEENDRYRYPFPIWEVTLTSEPEARGSKERGADVSARVELDAQTGRVLYFDIRHPDWASAEYPDEQIARAAADGFLQSFFGAEAKQWKATESLGRGKAGMGDEKGNKLEWARSTVHYQMLINEIPLIGDSLSVSVDAAGHIIRYEAFSVVDQAQVKWPDPQKVIAKGEAAKRLQDKLQTALMYSLDYPIAKEQDGKPTERKPLLVYVANPDLWIDALTGEAVGDEQAAPEETIPVKGKGKGTNVKISSRQEAEIWIKSQFGIDVSKASFEYDDHKENISEGLQQIKSYHWSNESTEGKRAYSMVSLITDAKSDRLIDFNLNVPDESAATKSIDVAEAKKKAIETLLPYLDPALEELKLVMEPADKWIPEWVDKSKLKQEEQREYSFWFHAKRNGVDVPDESYQVGVDKRTGAIVELYLHPLNGGVALPDATKIISAAEAKEHFKKDLDVQLVYYWEQYDGQRAPAPQLIYQQKWKTDFYFIDATTGKPVQVTQP
ncbi:peptidase [Brevibacillus fluminis]|uniref:Peptidase n=1 Tax=Brevibacillus fluminis TaxID=511487 RepID=A0A3M8DT70_9BACL|nr:YcdB/YcdC domain-containing protein [Brevibacillus fluminis]RNB91358.1 peptidase [Brevibacillus fluminis]